MHHGTYRCGMWWWQTLGYTPAGIECWNAMRCPRLSGDAQGSRPETPRRHRPLRRRGDELVDRRPPTTASQCIVPVAGIADLQAHVCEGDRGPTRRRRHHRPLRLHVLRQHLSLGLRRGAGPVSPRGRCCWATATPTTSFPCPATAAWPTRCASIYDLYGAGDQLRAAGDKGAAQGHARAAPRCLRLDEPLAQGRARVKSPTRTGRRWMPKQLKVFDRLPGRCRSTPPFKRYFIKPARMELPRSAEVARAWWAGKSKEWLDSAQGQGLPRLAGSAARARSQAGRGGQARRPAAAGLRISSVRKPCDCACGC